MIFNLNSDFSNNGSNETKVFHVPPNDNFSKYFVDGLLSKIDPKVLSSDPELLAKITILTSNKGLAKDIHAKLETCGLVILPKIVDLQNIQEILYDLPTDNGFTNLEPNRYKVISKLQRFLLLNNLIKKCSDDHLEKLPKLAAFELAMSLNSLIDDLSTNNLNSSDLLKLTDEELPKHLQLHLSILRRVLLSYENFIFKEKLIDDNTKYFLEVEEVVNAWKSKLVSEPIILVGSTGSQLATASLMQAITTLPQGYVVLPGLDTLLTDRAWDALSPDHPQYSFLLLCKKWKLEGTKRDKIIKSPPWHSYQCNESGDDYLKIRSRIISLVMRPGPVTDEWITEGKLLVSSLDKAMNTVTFIESENLRQEASSISIGIIEALEESSSVALVTPSKLLARRVTAELQRWNITPYNSLGVSLDTTNFGMFFLQAAAVIENNFQLKFVISLLQNKYCRDDRSCYDLNLSILQTAPNRLNTSFFDLAKSDWLFKQDKNFVDWFDWLVKIFQPMKLFVKESCLENLFSIHQEFLKQLMIGYLPNSNESVNKFKRDDDLPNDNEVQVFRVIEQQINGYVQLEHFEFWEYRRIVERILAETTYISRTEKTNARVSIWGTLESRTQHADVVVLGGLNEGTWPKYHNDDIWLSRNMRIALSADLQERKVGLSAHDFQQSAMTKKLILSRSKRNNLTPSIASRWLTRLENLLTGLGDQGQKCLLEMRLRGQMLSKLASEMYKSEFLVRQLNDELKFKAPRPAPIPPLSTRPARLSVTELELLIRNPYAIYAKKILKLKKIEHLAHSSDPRNKGNLVHETLEKFIFDNKENLPSDSEACEQLKEKFDSVLKINEIPVVIQTIWKAQFDNRVKEIVSLEKIRRLSGRPVALEIFGQFEFKMKNNESFFVTAKADRIDSGSNVLTIYDYKTGKITKRNLEKFSPQLDIEALMLVSGSFGKIFEEKEIVLSLIGLGSNPKQYEKTVKKENLDMWRSGLIEILEQMKLELSPFAAYSGTSTESNFTNAFQHLSRYGEWNDNDFPENVLIEMMQKNRN